MDWSFLAAFMLVSAPAGTPAQAPLYDPVTLNIGINCQWQKRCISDQRQAMKHALKYLAKYHPPAPRVAQCNRNASRERGGTRVDWVGFNNCVRNAVIVYVPIAPARVHHAMNRRHRLHRRRRLLKRLNAPRHRG